MPDRHAPYVLHVAEPRTALGQLHNVTYAKKGVSERPTGEGEGGRVKRKGKKNEKKMK